MKDVKKMASSPPNEINILWSRQDRQEWEPGHGENNIRAKQYKAHQRRRSPQLEFCSVDACLANECISDMVRGMGCISDDVNEFAEEIIFPFSSDMSKDDAPFSSTASIYDSDSSDDSYIHAHDVEKIGNRQTMYRHFR